MSNNPETIESQDTSISILETNKISENIIENLENPEEANIPVVALKSKINKSKVFTEYLMQDAEKLETLKKFIQTYDRSQSYVSGQNVVSSFIDKMVDECSKVN